MGEDMRDSNQTTGIIKWESTLENYFYIDDNMEYPSAAPYHPSEEYSEYPYDDEICRTSSNDIYDCIRKTMKELGLDIVHFDTKDWNPLGKYVSEGQTVLLKPNMVNHTNPAEEDPGRGMACLITHPSVVRCIFDYVFIALKGKGRIIIADAPIQGCNFDELLKRSGYGLLFNYLKGKETDDLKISYADLREVVYKKENGEILQNERPDMEYPGIEVDLGDDSYFVDVKKKENLRITCYDAKDTVEHHRQGHNVYKISSAVLCADIVISMPKPKSHRIAGYTAALKNMIGANARKEYLPHHRKGGKGTYSDEYTVSHGFLKWVNSTANDFMNHAVKNNDQKRIKFFNYIGRKTGRMLNEREPGRYSYGMWYGNDTIWRTILDVNHAVIYADKNGAMCDSPQRRMLCIGDMVICGDHEGPLSPKYKKVGGILFSDNPVIFDMIIVRLMGFDWKKLNTLYNAVNDKRLVSGLDPKTVFLSSNDLRFNKCISDIHYNFNFTPTEGWRGHI
jgi:uncharacterized protein (DUF362 family)